MEKRPFPECPPVHSKLAQKYGWCFLSCQIWTDLLASLHDSVRGERREKISGPEQAEGPEENSSGQPYMKECVHKISA